MDSFPTLIDMWNESVSLMDSGAYTEAHAGFVNLANNITTLWSGYEDLRDAYKLAQDQGVGTQDIHERISVIGELKVGISFQAAPTAAQCIDYTRQGQGTRYCDDAQKWITETVSLFQTSYVKWYN